ncbi:Glutamyl-tRNA synthetase [Acidisarcina polymorpha]|uniref:Glutamate--tRNA ligase n=1 Tax=Acidisarcina polymorpha TaxID=2211140 RepID=A0A2Z5FV89_9BACT|nr:glutamate--tRNA ligase [Acidisarcina polymorpha]AXC10809.1 Glutamyl-tRNA synthetase [Acidisarcina polymorpha]
MSTTKTRVRFAPSPTGLLHVGNARTALYNWLYARHTGGDFILRIEDTDLERSEERHEAQLMQDLQWMGLAWDEGPELSGAGGGPHGPYRQSERLEIYREHTARLLAEGKAYRCFCTPEELEAERKLAAAEHRPQIYSRRCLAIPPAESEARAASGEHFAVRLQIPDRPLRFHDLVRGDVEFAADSVSDPVLVRSASGASAGIPVYNYVVTIDDALMEITHVIRGDDHISNTPKQVAIYEAFGWKVPEFAHLSTILGADRERLSKRHGATSIASFREMGILPEALVNYLALLGWGAEGGLRETFTPGELINEFKLERVTASPAVFDFEKLNWLNRHYLKLAEPARITDLAWPYFTAAGLLPSVQSVEITEWFTKVLALFLPAVDRLDQLPGRTHFLFQINPDAAVSNPENAELLATENAQRVLAELAVRAREFEGDLTAELFKTWMNEIKAETGVKGKDLFHPVRIALTGSHSGPEFEKLIPLIEEGSTLALPNHLPSVRERIQEFTS